MSGIRYAPEIIYQPFLHVRSWEPDPLVAQATHAHCDCNRWQVWLGAASFTGTNVHNSLLLQPLYRNTVTIHRMFVWIICSSRMDLMCSFPQINRKVHIVCLCIEHGSWSTLHSYTLTEWVWPNGTVNCFSWERTREAEEAGEQQAF